MQVEVKLDADFTEPIILPSPAGKQFDALGLSVYHHWMCEAKKSVAYCVEIRKGSPE